MRTCKLKATAMPLISACLAVQALAQTNCHTPNGADVTVCEFSDSAYYGAVGDVAAFSIGTTATNVGDVSVSWFANNSHHPVIAQNIYRLKDGRFEQLGQSWLKHGFASTNDDTCHCGCENPGTQTLLGPGCSDTYVASLNGGQGGLGPRSSVNPHTGEVVYPFPTQNQGGDAIYKRIQVRTDDIDPGLNAGARYFAEAQYVSDDDATWGNQNNNASHHEIAISKTGSDYRIDFASFRMMAQQPALRAWQDLDPLVTETDVQIESDGLLIVDSRVTDLGAGVFHYEYAIYNMNSDRAVGSLVVPLPAGAVVSNAGFHAVQSHSGEIYSNLAWEITSSTVNVTWATSSFDVDPNANALRWGTLYNFWFDAGAAPVNGLVQLGLFKPGTPEMLSAAARVPGTLILGDLDHDCDVDLDDLATLLRNYGRSGLAYEDGDLDADTDVDVADLANLLAQYGKRCG